jgi:NAD(P)-dependent dehydrogenase (short-subunit alcohol dehydrogenase family)
LILAGRDRERVERSAIILRSETGANVSVLVLDLASLESVRTAAVDCRSLLRSESGRDLQLQSVICNAGTQSSGPVRYSADGYEETFASNCLGHFLLVTLLLDLVAADVRIVWTSSGTHDPATVDGKFVGKAAEPDAKTLTEQGREDKAMSAGRRYATSKLCLVLYAYELDRRQRHAGTSRASMAYDPGFIPDLGMGRQAPAILRTRPAKYLLRKLGMTMGQMPLSGEALAKLAVDEAFMNASGKYFQSRDGVLRETRSSRASYDEKSAAKIWSDSEALMGL